MLIGVDLGGSTLKAVAVTGAGAVLRRHVTPAGGRIARGDLLAAMRRAIDAVMPDGHELPVGVALGGAIQPDGTMLPTSTNLPNLAGIPLKGFLGAELGRPVRIDNDARAAMRGEAWSGAARHAGDALTMTFGTGIGSGLMLGRRIHEGAQGRAGEIGVWKLNDRTSGNVWPTLEQCAAPAQLQASRGKPFAELFQAGEADDVISWIGRAIANAHLLLDLEMCVLLGGITEIGEPFRAAVAEAFGQACQEDYHRGFSVRLGEHGALAGAVGAASLWGNAIR